MDNSELINEYVARQSNEAFAELVRRHMNLVYSTARRMVGDHALAEDVTQCAFIVFARKAATIDPRRLSGWLVNTTRLSAKEALRTTGTREKHERAAAGYLRRTIEDPTAEQIGPLLDGALAQLGEADRTVVVMRFLEGKTLAEIGAATQATEEASRKRVGRAVEKLRGIFMRQDLMPSVGGLMVALAAHQAAPAPAGLQQSVLKAAGRATPLARRVLGAMSRVRLQVATFMFAGSLLCGVALAFVLRSGPVAPVVAISASTKRVYGPAPTGRLTLTFTERSPLSDPGEFSIRAAYRSFGLTMHEADYDLARESFEAFIPGTYRPAKPYGLFVWMAPGGHFARRSACWTSRLAIS